MTTAEDRTRLLANENTFQSDRSGWTPGEALGRYIVRRELGRGGMGEVVTAYDPQLDREVAIKLVSVGGGSLDERRDARARLQQEAQALARLSHPNVVEVYDVQAHGDGIAVVMELVPGQTLKQWAATPRPWRQVVELMLGAGRGLAAAHDAGVVHRDFKPANVLVDARGRPRVLDFGLARVVKHGTEDREVSLRLVERGEDSWSIPVSDSFTVTGMVVGTPAYMAPEQHQGKATDERCDEFAFCVTLHELVYGRKPFVGENYAEIRAAALSGQLDASLVRKAPRRLWAIIAKGLQTDPERRYATMQALLDDLEGLLRRRNASAVFVLASLTAVPVAVHAAWKDPIEPCPSADALQTAWAQTQPAGQRAFEAVGRFGQSQWARVQPQLDDYVARWRSAYEPTCQAMQEYADVVHDETMSCLQSMRRDLEAATRVFAEADRETVLRAGEVVRALPDPATCEDDTVRSRRVNEGLDDAWAQRASYVETLVLAGSYARAEPLVAELVSDTPAADVRRLARARLLQGIVGINRVSDIDGVTMLEEAVMLARQVDDAPLAARAAVELTHHLGQDLHRYDAAKTWARHAAALLQRGPEDPELSARLWNALGLIVDKTEAMGNALPYYERALEVLESTPASPLAARVWNSIGNLEFKRSSDVAKAKAAWERSHALWVAALGEDHPDVLMPLHNLATGLDAEGKKDESDALLERVYAGWVDAYGEGHPKTLIPLSSLLLNAADENECARRLEIGYRGLRTIADDHPQRVSLLQGMAGAHRCLREWDACIDFAEDAVRHIESLQGPMTSALSFPLATMTRCYLGAGQPEAALAAVERASAIEHHHFGKPEPYTLQTVADVLDALGRHDEAVVQRRRVLASYEKKRREFVPIARFKLARAIRKAQGMTAEARALAMKAREQYLEDGDQAAVEEIDAWLASNEG